MIDIRILMQSDLSQCGPSVIKSICLHNNIDALESEIAKRCGHTYENGCDDAGMKRALESYGFAVEICNNATLEDIEYWVKFKVPTIVDWFSYNGAVGHSSIVVGIDKDKIYLGDPEVGDIIDLSREEFLRLWYDWRQPLISADPKNLIVRQLMIPYPQRLKDFHIKNNYGSKAKIRNRKTSS